jgi:hypothetical protein
MRLQGCNPAPKYKGLSVEEDWAVRITLPLSFRRIMLIKWVADYKYQAVAEFIHYMYTYHMDLDTYIPKFSVVDGKAMRTMIDISSGRSLAYSENATADELLTGLTD